MFFLFAGLETASGELSDSYPASAGRPETMQSGSYPASAVKSGGAISRRRGKAAAKAKLRRHGEKSKRTINAAPPPGSVEEPAPSRPAEPKKYSLLDGHEESLYINKKEEGHLEESLVTFSPDYKHAAAIITRVGELERPPNQFGFSADIPIITEAPTYLKIWELPSGKVTKTVQVPLKKTVKKDISFSFKQPLLKILISSDLNYMAYLERKNDKYKAGIIQLLNSKEIFSAKIKNVDTEKDPKADESAYLKMMGMKEFADFKTSSLYTETYADDKKRITYESGLTVYFGNYQFEARVSTLALSANGRYLIYLDRGYSMVTDIEKVITDRLEIAKHEAAAEKSRKADDYYNLGMLLNGKGTGYAVEAKAAFNAAIKADKDFIEAYVRAAELDLLLKNWDDAINDASLVIKNNDNFKYTRAHLIRGLAYLGKKMSEEAFRDFSVIPERDPKSSDCQEAYYQMGLYYVEKNDVENTRNYLLKSGKGEVMGNCYAWDMMLLHGKADSVYNETVVMTGSHAGVPQYWFYRGLSHSLSQWHDYSSEGNEYEKAYKLNPGNEIYKKYYYDAKIASQAETDKLLAPYRDSSGFGSGLLGVARSIAGGVNSASAGQASMDWQDAKIADALAQMLKEQKALNYEYFHPGSPNPYR